MQSGLHTRHDACTPRSAYYHYNMVDSVHVLPSINEMRPFTTDGPNFFLIITFEIQ